MVWFAGGVARSAAGHSLPFVLWFILLTGFADIAADAGLWLEQRWAAWLAVGIVVATAMGFVALGIHAATGGAYEARTVVAMTLRSLVWAAITGVAWRMTAQRNVAGQ